MKDKFLLSFFLFFLIFNSFLCSALTMTITIPKQYQEISAGDSVSVQTTIIWPENTRRQDLRIEYSVKDNQGNEIAYLKELRAVETQATFAESIPIPESTKAGIYTVYAQIDNYTGFNEQIAASFKINASQNLFQIYLFVILGVILLVAVLVTIELFILIKKK